MPNVRIRGVAVRGIASAVPDHVKTLDDDAAMFGEADAKRVFKNTGVKQRYTTENGMCASDLCEPAARRLLQELNWEASSVDVLVLVTQSPDYISPATACVLHARLGMGPDCAAFDVNLGCSGWVYGLWLVSALLTSGGGTRALLLVGDVVTRTMSPADRSVAPLFGDAGTATALECAADAPPMDFVIGSDGAGARHLMVPAGGFRLRAQDANAALATGADGNTRSLQHTHMNGAEVFTFTLASVPKLLKDVMARAGWSHEDVDWYVFHQASTFMLKTLCRSCGIPTAKFVIAMENYGNTSSASIPLAICDRLRENLGAGSQRLVLAGFGVGWSWGAVALTLGPLCVLPVLVVADQPPHEPLSCTT
ncbi:MAG: 3-oxoacyl-ACP synthase [Myxococcaceae bacterium]|nr:3-oxoacyl-ACP synthase [Myxococcaceae bacterium]